MEFRRVANGHPDWLDMTWFFLRSSGLKALRLAQDAVRRVPVLPMGAIQDFPYVIAESVADLKTSADPRERLLVLGKIHNLRLACRSLHRRVLTPGQIFSFWRQIGPPWRLRGFARGREVREGCVIPTFGGGLCQLSGSLLEVALAAGLDLVEKHNHTILPADVPRDPRRDATLFWNYVDLRFRSPAPTLFECFLSSTALVVRVRARGQNANFARRQAAASCVLPITHSAPAAINSCHTCSQAECARHVKEPSAPSKTAFLLDEYQPEFGNLVRLHLKVGDQLLVPFMSREGWSRFRIGGPHNPESSHWFRMRRSLLLRWARFRGVTVARAYFELAGSLAKFYESRIGYDVEHLYVAQTLLPHLWRSGILAGRTFDVLMQRLPVAALAKQLDMAAELYPRSRTLVEFRAPRWFADAEQEALESARSVFTPHAQLASLHPRAVRLPWEMPAARQTGDRKPRDLMVFFGPTLARKGAYQVRDAVRQTGVSLVVPGPELEEPGFWGNLPVTRLNSHELPWERIHTVVQPALVEYWPRQLLKAHAAGANLVITHQCGLDENNDSGIHHVPFGDVNKLAETLARLSRIGLYRNKDEDTT